MRVYAARDTNEPAFLEEAVQIIRIARKRVKFSRGKTKEGVYWAFLITE